MSNSDQQEGACTVPHVAGGPERESTLIECSLCGKQCTCFELVFRLQLHDMISSKGDSDSWPHGHSRVASLAFLQLEIQPLLVNTVHIAQVVAYFLHTMTLQQNLHVLDIVTR